MVAKLSVFVRGGRLRIVRWQGVMLEGRILFLKLDLTKYMFHGLEKHI